MTCGSKLIYLLPSIDLPISSLANHIESALMTYLSAISVFRYTKFYETEAVKQLFFHNDYSPWPSYHSGLSLSMPLSLLFVIKVYNIKNNIILM